MCGLKWSNFPKSDYSEFTITGILCFKAQHKAVVIGNKQNMFMSIQLCIPINDYKVIQSSHWAKSIKLLEHLISFNQNILL